MYSSANLSDVSTRPWAHLWSLETRYEYCSGSLTSVKRALSVENSASFSCLLARRPVNMPVSARVCRRRLRLKYWANAQVLLRFVDEPVCRGSPAGDGLLELLLVLCDNVLLKLGTLGHDRLSAKSDGFRQLWARGTTRHARQSSRKQRALRKTSCTCDRASLAAATWVHAALLGQKQMAVL